MAVGLEFLDGGGHGDSLRGAELTKLVVVKGADGYRVAFALVELDPAYADRPLLLVDRMNAPLPEDTAPYRGSSG